MTLAVITPGPTLSVYQNGKLVAEVRLSVAAALKMIADLAREIRL